MNITEEISPIKCPGCGKIFDRTIIVQGRRGPRPGDITVCLSWEATCMYEADMTLHRLTDEDWKTLNHKARDAIKSIRRAIVLARFERNLK